MKKMKKLLFAVTCIFILIIGTFAAFAEESYTDKFDFTFDEVSDVETSGVVNKVSGRTFARAVITDVRKTGLFGGETNAVTKFWVVDKNYDTISATNTASNHQSFSMKYNDSKVTYSGESYLRGAPSSASGYRVKGSWSPNQYQ